MWLDDALKTRLRKVASDNGISMAMVIHVALVVFLNDVEKRGGVMFKDYDSIA